jgi:hypothetical protein
VIAAKRERPVDGGIVWHERFNAFECLGCGEFEEIRKRADRTPARLVELKELLVKDHTECWEYSDAQMARDARRYRSKKKQREILGQGSGVRDQRSDRSRGLAAQRVSWRGGDAGTRD